MEKTRAKNKRKRVGRAFKNILTNLKHNLAGEEERLKRLVDNFGKPKYSIGQLIAFGYVKPEHREWVIKEIGRIIFEE